MELKKLFLNSIEFKPVERTPVWLMRQAGRYQKEYLNIREKYDFLTMCKTPQIASEVTMLPLNIIDPDALIVFSDILTMLEPLGVNLHFDSHGPVIENTVREESSFKKLAVFDSEKSLKFVYETIKMVKDSVKAVPLFGFSGAPFTLATYLVEGRVSKNFSNIKRLLNADPDLLKNILDLLTGQITDYLKMQINAGVDFIQIFDTWAGILSRDDYFEFAHPFQKKIIQSLKDYSDRKIFLYVNGSTHLMNYLACSGADIISLDWRCDLKEISKRFPELGLQGNIDPTVLYGSKEHIKLKVVDLYEKLNRKTGYIFNLGHGILPDIDAEKVRFLVETVKNVSYEYNRKRD